MFAIKYKRPFWYLFIPLFLFINNPIKSQELLIGLGENNIPGKPVRRIQTKSLMSLDLPFVDDFSRQGQVFPNPALWVNSNCVYVNRTYAINPPTVGVATFDPFDSKGKIYDRASSSTFPADTLTSAPIDLNYLPSDSIYLSFYIQPQGYGDIPESNDSLSLEFYSPADSTWHYVWSASVISSVKMKLSNHMNHTSDTITHDSIGYNFFRVDINISDTSHLKDDFSFRFVNYASINIHPSFPGRSTASDHWHLDYVYLDKNRTKDNRNIEDIGITKEPKRILSIYETVPARHLNAANDLFESPMNLELSYTNLGWGTKSVTRNFRLRSIHGSGNTLSYSAGAENIENGRTIDLSYPVTPPYNFSATDDSASFEILSWIITDTDPSAYRTALRYNDTNRIIYEFRDYYAYDDGTAENGYGLFGSGSSNGKVAVKFNTYMADSLRGVYMYFNRAVNDVNENSNFIVAVWSDADGIPGTIIHQETGGKPAFRDSLNRFVAYKFQKPVYLEKGSNFYVGWLQTDESFINIGFDRNRMSKTKTFYNLGQIWEQSAFEGSLMIRPVFCSSDANFPSDYEELEFEEPASKNTSFKAYPNPVRSILYLEENDKTPVVSSKIELFGLSGELVKVFENVTGNIDLTVVSSGVYLMRVWSDGKIREVKRIVIGK